MSAALYLYRLSLRLLPADLRHDFGDDMVQLFRDELGAVRGPLARFGLFAAALTDVAKQSRRKSRGSMFNGLRQSLPNFPNDFRHGVRLLRRYPATAIVAIATLALGIGVNTAIFSVVDAVLLKSLPYPNPEQLVTIYESRSIEKVANNSVSPADMADWREMSKSFSAMAGFTGNTALLSGSGEPVQLTAGIGSAGFFDVFGIQPFMGRGFLREEEVRGKHRVVVITYGLWQRQFGGDPNIVGKQITLTGNPWEVIGVLPRDFAFFDSAIDMFTPLAMAQPLSRGGHSLEVFARLKPGVTLSQAHAEMEQIGKNLEAAYPDISRGHGANVVAMQDDAVSGVRPALVLVTVAVTLVLLLASVNVANLMLVRAARRERELAVRAALGADRWRLIVQSFAECFAVAAAGGIAGLGLAALFIRALPLVLPEQLSVVRTDQLHLDMRVLLAAGALTIVTAFVFGLLPALRASRPDVIEPLKQGGRGAATISGRMRLALIVSEVTLASLALVGGALIVRSFAAIASQPLGLSPRNRMTLDLSAPAARYTTDAARRDAMLELERRLSAIPGVSAVGGIDVLPLSGDDSRRTVVIEGLATTPSDPPTRMHPRSITPAFFRASGVVLQGGRALADSDTADTPLVSVINEAAAKRFWPGQDPIGKRWSFGVGDPWITIVGISADVRHWGLSKAVNPTVYLPEPQDVSGALTFVAETTLDKKAFAAAARDAVHGFDANLAVGNLRTMDEVISESLKSQRAITVLMTTFGVLALLLAGIGIYGVMSQLVSSRVQEIGVRMALGAKPLQILTQILSGCAGHTAIGLLIGGITGVYLMSVTNMLFGIKPWDPVTLLIVSATILAASVLACVVPALRAMRVDPVKALRG